MKKPPRGKKRPAGKVLPQGGFKQDFPQGWNERKVRAVIAHYDNQTDDERAAEIETALEAEGHTLVSVPTSLIPAVVRLIQRHGKSA